MFFLYILGLAFFRGSAVVLAYCCCCILLVHCILVLLGT